MFGIVEIPANLSGFVLIQHIGRRISQAGFLFFGGAACLVILAIPKGTFKTLDMFLLAENVFIELSLLQIQYIFLEYQISRR